MNTKLYKGALFFLLFQFFGLQHAYCNDFQSLYDSAKQHRSTDIALLALQAAEQQQDIKWLAKAHYLLAYYYQGDRQYFEAIKHYYSALSYFRDSKNQKYRIACLQNLGILYSKAHFSHKSLQFYHDGLALAQMTGDSQAEALLRYEIGYVETSIGRYDSALYYLNTGIALLKRFDRNDVLSDAYIELGYIAVQQQDSILSEAYYDSAIQVTPPTSTLRERALLRKANSDAHLAIANNNLVIAEEILNEALHSISKKENNQQVISEVYLNLAVLHRKRGANDPYIRALEHYVQHSELLDFNEQFPKANYQLVKHYEQIDLKKSAPYLDLMLAYTQELSIVKKELEQMHMRYQVQAADYHIALQKKNEEMARQHRNKLIVYGIVSVIIIVCMLMAYYLTVRLRQTKEAKETIHHSANSVLRRVQNPSV